MPFDLNDDQVNQLRNGGWLRPDQGINPAASAPASPQDAETTSVPPALQNKFQQWLKDNKVTDYGNPNSFYDYGGAFLGGVNRDKEDGHFPDTYKQHGHPTFSVESQYSAGPNDGGRWDGDKFVPPQQAKTDAVKPIDAGTTTIVGNPQQSAMPPKDLDFMGESKRYEQSQLGTLQGRQDLVAEGAARQAAIIDQMAQEQERSAKEFQQDNQREAALSDYARSHATTMYDGLRSQVKTAMAQQIDPNRFFNTRSPLLAIGAAISAGLGAYGAAINHTPNFALDIINRAIDRDNESQVKGIENQWKGISANIDIADRDAAADKYKVEQFNRLKVQKLEASKALVASYASRSDSETVKNNAALLINGIDGYINSTIHQGTLERRAFLQQQQASAFAAQQNQLKLAREDAKAATEEYVKATSPEGGKSAADALKDMRTLHPLGFAFLQQLQGRDANGNAIPLTPESFGNAGVRRDAAQEKETREREQAVKQGQADLDEINSYRTQADVISSAQANGPSIVLDDAESRKRQQVSSSYDAFVRRMVAKIYKAQTGGVEPKNEQMVSELAAPYLSRWVSTENMQARIDQLEHDYRQALSSSVALPPPQVKPSDIGAVKPGSVPARQAAEYQGLGGGL